MALELSEAARELVLEASQDPALGLDPPQCERWGSGRCCARRIRWANSVSRRRRSARSKSRPWSKGALA